METKSRTDKYSADKQPFHPISPIPISAVVPVRSSPELTAGPDRELPLKRLELCGTAQLRLVS